MTDKEKFIEQENIKILIEIDKEIYKRIQEDTYCGILNSDIYEAIKNGRVFPDNHGRIVKGDIILAWLIHTGVLDNLKCGEVADVFREATILEGMVKE